MGGEIHRQEVWYRDMSAEKPLGDTGFIVYSVARCGSHYPVMIAVDERGMAALSVDTMGIARVEPLPEGERPTVDEAIRTIWNCHECPVVSKAFYNLPNWDCYLNLSTGEIVPE